MVDRWLTEVDSSEREVSTAKSASDLRKREKVDEVDTFSKNYRAHARTRTRTHAPAHTRDHNGISLSTSSTSGQKGPLTCGNAGYTSDGEVSTTQEVSTTPPNRGGRPRKPEEHGTERGYQQHRYRGTKACDVCRAAHAEHNRRGKGP